MATTGGAHMVDMVGLRKTARGGWELQIEVGLRIASLVGHSGDLCWFLHLFSGTSRIPLCCAPLKYYSPGWSETPTAMIVDPTPHDILLSRQGKKKPWRPLLRDTKCIKLAATPVNLKFKSVWRMSRPANWDHPPGVKQPQAKNESINQPKQVNETWKFGARQPMGYFLFRKISRGPTSKAIYDFSCTFGSRYSVLSMEYSILCRYVHMHNQSTF